MVLVKHQKVAGLFESPAYSHAVVASGTRTIFTSGQVCIDENGMVVGAGDLAAQTGQVMHNLGLALAAGGASFSDVVKTTMYVVNYKPEDRLAIGKARAPFFAGMMPPASTLVGVGALAHPDWLIEIEAIAVLD